MVSRPAARRPRLGLALGAGLAGLSLALAPTAASAATTAQAADVTVTLRITIGAGDPSWPADSVIIGMPDDSPSGRYWDCQRGFTTGVPKDVVVTVPEGTFLPVWSSHGCYDALSHGNGTATTDGEIIEVIVP
ncbi:hypothetical protein [Streptomyces litchfieldiae]|uniref:Uncharacterized protein n=1 Tax=Streptomyces litchfieldiae TaxID=3075543 RepID=A0ABU2MPT4_9ACTN|nr:hypothetical protein [Streptomyces sp. DSM 44938]MDT0343625.1 hypothetical protein [Streptomyces sp. DSM 44938]